MDIDFETPKDSDTLKEWMLCQYGFEGDYGWEHISTGFDLSGRGDDKFVWINRIDGTEHPIATVGELKEKFTEVTGKELFFNNSRRPITGQGL